MSEAVLVALITGACAVVSQVVISARSTKELYNKIETQSKIADEQMRSDIAIVKAEIAELRKQVEKHNSVVERTFAIEQKVAVQEEQIKVANKRIGDLEKTAS